MTMEIRNIKKVHLQTFVDISMGNSQTDNVQDQMTFTSLEEQGWMALKKDIVNPNTTKESRRRELKEKIEEDQNRLVGHYALQVDRNDV